MPNPDGQEREPTRDEVEANRNEFAKLLIRLRERRISGTGEGDPVKVAVEVRDAARAGLVAALAAREDTERPEEVTRLREGLERALDVSFIVGLLRVRAGKTDDAELAEWGERLKGQLVAIREVLSPGTAAAMAELRDTERPDDRPAREKFERK